MWYVYFLKLANDTVYIGSTGDLRQRVDRHLRGQVVSTRPHRPLMLQSYIAVPTELHARQLERYFKSGSGKAFALKRLTRVMDRAEPG